jgi:hypothetical protein
MSVYTQYGLDAASAFLDLLGPVTQTVAVLPQSVLAPAVNPGPPQAQQAVLEEPDLDSGALQLALEYYAKNPGVQSRALKMSELQGPPFPKDPVYSEVEQGYLLNCPIPAVMAAIAHVKDGPAKLRTMITEVKGVIQSERNPNLSELYDKEPFKKEVYQSARIFEVSFATAKVKVTPWIFYDQRKASPGSIVYGSSTLGAPWPSILEKAYAAAYSNNSYNGLDNATAETVLQNMYGAGRQEPIATGNLAKILEGHGKHPTIVGSLNNQPDAAITGNHAFAVVGFTKKTKKDKGKTVLDEDTSIVTLYDANSTSETQITVTALKARFGEVVQ